MASGEQGAATSQVSRKQLHTVWGRFALNDCEGNADHQFGRSVNSLFYGDNVTSASPAKLSLLDLFCCAGGAGKGYSQSGFDVVGVDIRPQPRYPFPFVQADALSLDPEFIASFDTVHASPPCQSYSDLAKLNGNADKWPRLIEPVREMLIRSGLPYVIENVEGAPLLNPVTLCGTMFPPLRVLRHRLFEANFAILPPPHKKHPRVHTHDRRKSHFGKTDEWTDYVQVTGGGNCTVAAAREAMGIDWMTKGEINESIPPAYTEYIGWELRRYISFLRLPHACDKALASRAAGILPVLI